jgi:phosphocarrier protein
MIERKIVITNKLGLHARPAALLVETASRFIADVTIIKDNLKVNGKSIMSVLMLAAEYKSEIILQIDGEDEKESIEAMTKLFKNKFNEK